jgi:hypothetical protein
MGFDSEYWQWPGYMTELLIRISHYHYTEVLRDTNKPGGHYTTSPAARSLTQGGSSVDRGSQRLRPTPISPEEHALFQAHLVMQGENCTLSPEQIGTP